MKNKNKLSKRQEANLELKVKPLSNREYVLTDQCFWNENAPADYNQLDPNRKPHGITLVDKENGSIVFLESGSTIKVIVPYKHKEK